MSKSSHKEAFQILGVISPAKAEEILMALANAFGEWPLTDDAVGYKRMMSGIDRIRSKYRDVFKHCTILGSLALRDLLRKAWTSRDSRRAEWFLFRLRHLHWEMMHRERQMQKAKGKPEPEIPTIPGTIEETMRFIAESEPPPISEFEACVFYFQKNLRRAVYCQNPTCAVTPYFFSREKGQKYCSEPCVAYGQREAKRKWWNENRAKSKRK